MFYKYEYESGYKCCIFGTESPCKWNAAKDKNNSQQCSKNKYKSPIGITAEKEIFWPYAGKVTFQKTITIF